MPTSRLRFESVRLGTLPAPLTCTLFPGDRAGIVGISEADGSALLRAVVRLTVPIAGRIAFNEKAVPSIHPLMLRREAVLLSPRMGWLDMTAAEAIAYPLRLRGLSANAIAARVERWVERLGIDRSLLSRNELQLPQAEVRWVAIARALAIEAPLLLLDDPTCHLDPDRRTCLAGVLRECGESGTTLLAANSDPVWLGTWCDRAIVAVDGAMQFCSPASREAWAQWQRAPLPAPAPDDAPDDWDA